MKLFLAVIGFILSWSFIALAQSAPAPSAGGIMGFMMAHGGFQASVLMLVTFAFSILSAIRALCLQLDGIPQGGEIPADKSSLTLLNKVCIVLGQIIDFIQGNMKH